MAFTWSPPNAYSGSAAQPQQRNRTRIIVKFFVLFFCDFANTPIHSTLLYMPRPSKSAKKKATGIAKACQSRHTSRASSPGLLVPDPETSPITPKGSRSSSPSFEIMNDLYSGNISDGMMVETATDSHLVLDKNQEEDEWDEQGYVIEGEELDDIYGDGELEELEGEELEASLKLSMENQLERIEQSNESYQPTPYESTSPLCRVPQHLSGRRQSQREALGTVALQLPGQKWSIGRRQEKLKR
jgi:hypothetical protein